MKYVHVNNFVSKNAYEKKGSESKIDYRLTIMIIAKDITKTIPPAPTTNKK